MVRTPILLQTKVLASQNSHDSHDFRLICAETKLATSRRGRAGSMIDECADQTGPRANARRRQGFAFSFAVALGITAPAQ
jgi:hypothetical protein